MEKERKKQFIHNQARHFRLEAGLKQSDVAFLLDIKNVGRISEWENGLSNPSIEHLLSLSLIYQKLPDQLYSELRRQLARKLEERKRLLREVKEKKKGLDRGG